MWLQSFCSMNNTDVNKIRPIDISKIMFDNEKLFKITLATFYKKEGDKTYSSSEPQCIPLNTIFFLCTKIKSGP